MTKTILIIEDDQDILDIITYILSNEGYQIISATDSSPLKNLIAIQPSLILLDNWLADGYGKDMCRQIKEDPARAHFPVILFSANNNLEKMAAECKADAYLLKPFDMDVLLKMVNRYCE
jgi:DNA-binding response OmpR family regulator